MCEGVARTCARRRIRASVSWLCLALFSAAVGCGTDRDVSGPSPIGNWQAQWAFGPVISSQDEGDPRRGDQGDAPRLRHVNVHLEFKIAIDASGDWAGVVRLGREELGRFDGKWRRSGRELALTLNGDPDAGTDTWEIGEGILRQARSAFLEFPSDKPTLTPDSRARPR